MSYAVVIVHYKQPALLRQVLDSLEKQTLQPVLRFIVDNGRSLDLEAREALTRRGYQVIGADNLGYAAAVNQVRLRLPALVESLLVLTHDVYLEEEAVRSMVAFASSRDRVGVVGPILNFVSQPDRLFSRGGLLKWGRRPVHIRTEDVSSRPEWVDGAVMLLSVQALNEVDWLDERYFLYFEEIDLCLSMRAQGWSIDVAEDARARQEPGNYTPYLATRNQVLLGRRHGHRLSTFILIAARVLREAIVAIRSRDTSSTAGTLRGLVDGVLGRGGPPSEPAPRRLGGTSMGRS